MQGLIQKEKQCFLAFFIVVASSQIYPRFQYFGAKIRKKYEKYKTICRGKHLFSKSTRQSK